MRYDPSCQIFTALRRHLLELRQERGSEEVSRCLDMWLSDEAVPEKTLLLRGLLLMLHEWRLVVDLMLLPPATPSTSHVPLPVPAKQTLRAPPSAVTPRRKLGLAQGESALDAGEDQGQFSGLTLRMFELMTRPDARGPPAPPRVVASNGDRLEAAPLDDDDVDEDEIRSDLEDLDEALANDPRIRCENPILRRFLQDAQHRMR